MNTTVDAEGTVHNHGYCAQNCCLKHWEMPSSLLGLSAHLALWDSKLEDPSSRSAAMPCSFATPSSHRHRISALSLLPGITFQTLDGHHVSNSWWVSYFRISTRILDGLHRTQTRDGLCILGTHVFCRSQSRLLPTYPVQVHARIATIHIIETSWMCLTSPRLSGHWTLSHVLPLLQMVAPKTHVNKSSFRPSLPNRDALAALLPQRMWVSRFTP